MQEVQISGEGEMKYIVAIIAVEAIVEIFMHSALFANFRTWIGGKHELLDVFVTCGWCLSVWVALLVFGLIYIGLWVVLIPLAIHRMSNFIHDIDGLVKRSGWRK